MLHPLVADHRIKPTKTKHEESETWSRPHSPLCSTLYVLLSTCTYSVLCICASRYATIVSRFGLPGMMIRRCKGSQAALIRDWQYRSRHLESLIGRGGFWIKVGDHALHVGAKKGVDRQATKAHVAYRVDNLEWWRARLTEAGVSILDSAPISGQSRFECRDPFGNRVEFITATHDS